MQGIENLKMTILQDIEADHEPEIGMASNNSDIGHEVSIEDLFSDDDIEIEELKQRIHRDKNLLKMLKEQNKLKERNDITDQRVIEEKRRRKKMSRAHDGMLRNMLKMMDVCKAQGFVYGIIPENGKPMTGASDNLREWWQETVRFVQNGPAAVLKYEDKNSTRGGKREIDLASPVYPPPMDDGLIIIEDDSEDDMVGRKDEFEDPNNISFINKRKPTVNLTIGMDQNLIYTCEFFACPYNDLHFGFRDRISRDNHRLSCEFAPGSKFGGNHDIFNSAEPSLFSPVELQPSILPQCFLQANSDSSPVNFDHLDFNPSANDVPDGGQNMISGTEGHTMTYDLNLEPQGPQIQHDFFLGPKGNIYIR
ncbi:hypothetical protein ACFE04_012976 [Oxalis oulophora]